MLNIYAQSGKNLYADREDFFDKEIPFYLRHNSSNTFMGGDFNAVLSLKDVSNNSPSHLSKTLLKLIRQAKIVDAWWIHNNHVEYTYVRQNYGSRIDRFYINNKDNINSSKVVHCSFSDHSTILINVNINENICIGKSYWKLNTSLLRDENVKENFANYWGYIKSLIYNYENELVWWETCAKPKIKAFFIKEGKIQSKEKYGLIEYLEYKLKKLYVGLENNNTINYQSVKEIKEHIDKLKSDILEGAQIRSKLQEVKYGEMPSSYLVSKLNAERTKKSIYNLVVEENFEEFNVGDELETTEEINNYANNYFRKLYQYEENDSYEQDSFINSIERQISDIDNEMINKEVELSECKRVLNSVECNKSPGIDGLPYEFYQTFWDLIKNEFIRVIAIMKNTLVLSESQNLAVITLQPKDGDTKKLVNWRPISLMCCDYKILSKIIANRLRFIIPDAISEEQFCCPGRTIVDNNILLRDVIYYSNEQNLQGAVLSLDWTKAFDRINHDFLYKSMEKMGFDNNVISLIKLFCSDKKSCLQINGNILEEIDIGRGIRQGCPLSMIIYVIFKEPLYKYIKSCNTIEGIQLPNNNLIKISGYADDTNLFTINYESIISIFNVLTKFEAATGALLNKRKTKIFGIGTWRNKTEWPISWLHGSVNSFESLGIIFANDYDLAVTQNWESILNSIDVKLRMMQTIKLTIYQKAIMINCIVYAKLWYVSHVYPLSLSYANKIKRLTFHYLWGKRFEPIKRTTLTLPKHEGGLGIIDIFYKSQSILASSFIKYYNNENGIKCLVDHYNNIRCAQLLNITSSPQQVSYIGTKYYREIIPIIRKCTHVRGFPQLSAKMIYKKIMPNYSPNIENLYGLYNWSSIWKNLSSAYILVHEREIMYKHLHEILPTKKRLKDIRKIESSICDHCNQEESNTHFVYQCERHVEVLIWFKSLLQKYCNLNNPQLIKLCFLFIPKMDKKCKNATIMLMSTFIVSMWQIRNNEMNQNACKRFIKGKLLQKQQFIKHILGNSMEKLLPLNVCNMKRLDL